MDKTEKIDMVQKTVERLYERITWNAEFEADSLMWQTIPMVTEAFVEDCLGDAEGTAQLREVVADIFSSQVRKNIMLRVLDSLKEEV